MRLNKIFRILKYLFLSLVFLFVLLLAGINLPISQRIISKKINGFLIQKNLPVSVEKVTLLLNGKVGFKKLQMLNYTGDTVVFVQDAAASVRIMPLLFRKIIVKNITINGTTVHITSDPVSGKPDIVSMIAPGPGPENKSKKTGQKWDISVISVKLNNILFTYTDAFHGLSIHQSVGKLSVVFDSFSLIRRQLYAGFIELNKVSGGVSLCQSGNKSTTREESPGGWEFKLTAGDLTDIDFILHQPDASQRMEFFLDQGDISEAGVNLATREISVSNIILKDPGVDMFLSGSDQKTKSDTKETKGDAFLGGWNISGNKIKIDGGSFHSGDYNGNPASLSKNGFLQVSELNSALNDVKLSHRESGFIMDHLSLTLDNGFNLEKGDIRFRSDSTQKTLIDLNLKSTSGTINLEAASEKELVVLLESYKDVPFNLNIEGTEILIQDILSFIPEMNDEQIPEANKDLRIGIECSVSGTANMFEIGNLLLNSSSGVTLTASGDIINITDPLSSVCSVEFKTSTINPSQVNEFMKMAGISVILPEFEPLTLEGTITDSLMVPEILLSLNSNSGNIVAAGSINLIRRSYDLNMKYQGLDLRLVKNNSDMGKISGTLNLAGTEFNPEMMKISASLFVDTVGYKDYDYKRINVKVEGDNGLYKFVLNSSDSSFKTDLAGEFEHRDSINRGQVSGFFGIDAGNLNLLSDLSFSGELSGNIQRSPGDLNAAVSLKDITISNSENSEDLENLSFSLHSSDSLVEGKAISDFLKTDFYSRGSVLDLKRIITESRFRIATLLDSTKKDRIPLISSLPETSVTLETTYDPIIGIFLNDSIFKYGTVQFNLSKNTAGIASTFISTDRLYFGPVSGFNAVFQFEGLPEKSVLTLKADSVRYGKIVLTVLETDISVMGDSSVFRLKADDSQTRQLYDISGMAQKKDFLISLKSGHSQWIINGFRWDVSPGDLVIIYPEEKDFMTDMHLAADDHSIDITGRKSDIMNFKCNNVNIGMLLIPEINTYNTEGILSGRISYQGHDGNEIGIQMDVNQIKLGEDLIGNLNIDGNYISDTSGAIESKIRMVLNDTSLLNVDSGRKDKNQKFIKTDFSGIPLNILESFTSKYISELNGDISGGISVNLTEKKPSINGEIRIENTGLRVIPLNALFYLPDDIIKLENNQMVFSRFTVLDSLNKQLNINGTIDLNDPENISADLDVTSDLLQVMNTTEKDNSSFYGDIFVNSKLKVSGPVLKPSIQGSIVLAEGTVINYSYVEDLSVSETQKVITFASLSEEQADASKEKIILNPISRTPDIETSVEIDPNSLFNFQISRGFDIGANIRGGGFLTYSLMPNKTINLSGTYEINEGNAQLKIPGWPRKDFTITPGSYLKWDGKVDDPELNLETTSKVRGSYLNPVDQKNREVNFLVYMKLADRLSQLAILFDVRSEDQYLTSVFNSLSADERMRQAINLLIFGSIQLPNLESSSDYVSQQINQFWESQLNQLTQSSFKNFDVSLGVDTYTDGGTNQKYTSFSYEVKKEMFNNRGSVLLSGHSNYNSPTTEQANAVIENFIFEYALDTSRTKFLKVYRQQNYEDLLEGEVIKSGVGFIYRKNYARLSDIWHRPEKKKPNKKVRN